MLDLGCGAGQDARALKRARYEVIGLDFTRPLLQYARSQSPRLRLVQADVRYLPLRAGHFNMVWAAASLIHLSKSSVRESLRELYRLVTPGGVIAATFIHGRRSGISQDNWIPDRFISRWLKSELTAAVSEAGWTIDQLTAVNNRERQGRWLNLIARRTLS